MALTTVNSAGVKDDSIVNADIKSDAAIAGTKISPSFTSDIIITNSAPKIDFVDTNANSDFQIKGNAGKLDFIDTTNNAERFRINSDGDVLIPADNAELRIGASDDLKLYHDGTDSIISNATNVLKTHSSHLYIRNAAGNEDLAKFIQDGAVELYYDNSKKFETKSDGATVHGHLYQEDNEAHYLGSANDLTLWHDGTDSRIRYNHTVGSLKFQKNDNSDAMVIDLAGRVGIGRTPKSYHSNNKGIIEGDSGWVVHGRSNNWLGIGQNHYYDSADLGKYRTAGEASMYIQQDGKHTFYVAASGSEDATCSLQSVLVAKNDRNVEITDGNLIVASGHGIDFSATSDATGATSELLDDYEEGLVTATCSNSVTLHSTDDTFSYTKVGRLVTLMGQLRVNSDNSNATFTITNIPFTSADLLESADHAAGACRIWSWDINVADHVGVMAFLGGGSTTLSFYVNRDGQSAESLPASAGGYIGFSITYTAA